MKSRKAPVFSVCHGIGTVVFACVVQLSFMLGWCIADEVSLTPTADTYVDEYNPNTSFGASTGMVVAASWFSSGDDDMTRISYLRFDYSSIPQGSTIDYAEFRLTRKESGWYVNPGVNLGVSGLSNPNWSESTLTWNNAPFIGTAPIGTLRLGTATSWVWKDTDFDNLLSYVIDKVVNNYANFATWKTWVLRGADWGGGQIFYTREYSVSSLRPKLYIRFTPPPPNKATNPSPSNGATNQSINTDVSWSNGGGATSYDVYFGTDPTPDSGEYKGNQTSRSYDPGTLAYYRTYYWRIDAKNSSGTTTGDVWSFMTSAAPRTLTVASSNPDSGVNISVSPNDNNGQGSGTTQFTRTYNKDTVVTLTAPSTAGGNTFEKWTGDAGYDVSTNRTITVTMDNDHVRRAVYTLPSKPTVTITTTDSQTSEVPLGSGPPDYANFRVNRTGSTFSQLVVYFSKGGSAVWPSDYVWNGGPDDIMVIQPGQSYADYGVDAVDDTLVEGNETIIWTLVSNSAYTVGSPSNATITIIDNDIAKPTVSIVATDSSAAEPANNGYFTVSRTGSTSGNIRVYYGTSGSTAASGSDYAALPGYVDIPSGQSSALISVVVINDSQVESSETVKVTLSSNSAYKIGSPSSATVTISDDDDLMCDFCGANSDQPDGYVDYWDLLYFAQRWHTDPSDTNWDPRCDLDKEDNYVDYWDLLVFAQQWHKGVKP